jgi:hypothetical protein
VEGGSEQEVGVVCLPEERSNSHEQTGSRQIGGILVEQPSSPDEEHPVHSQKAHIYARVVAVRLDPPLVGEECYPARNKSSYSHDESE